MKICQYCNSKMCSEFETQKDKSYNFFYICLNCRSIYEGKKDKNNIVLKSRWWNNDKRKFENIYNY
ncbi:MAG: hypothetical protein IKF52_05550 [Clostridia bacterium]|nr:hypothetical protein [Clostridia bacterium]